MWDEMVVANFKFYSDSYIAGLLNITKNLSEDDWPQGQI
jgi:hypothetical protein